MSALQVGDHVVLDGNPADVRSVVATRPALAYGKTECRLLPATGDWVSRDRLTHVEGYSHREAGLSEDPFA